MDQGLATRMVVSQEEQTAIDVLREICDRHEGLLIRVGNRLSRAANDTVDDYFYYADGQLVGYLMLDGRGSEDRELTGMVHPEYRRRGIFTTLFEAARSECQQHQIEKLILVCEQKAVAGKAFISSMGAQYAFSEHQMLLEKFQPSNRFDERLTFRKADREDLDQLAAVQAASFSDTEEQSRAHLLAMFQDPTRHFYIATFGTEGLGCEEPVGLLRLDDSQEMIGIYGFGVHPDYQGRGYGRQMLEEAIRVAQQTSQKQIMLDVESGNTKAQRLYLSSGFVIQTTYDYYEIVLEER